MKRKPQYICRYFGLKKNENASCKSYRIGKADKAIPRRKFKFLHLRKIRNV